MTIKEAKEIDIVDYLSRLGHSPVKISEPHYWYNSPIREERTPSFKVNRRLNRWKDWGSGQSGNLVDFGILYHNCDISEFLKKINDAGGILRHNQISKDYAANSEDKQNEGIKITAVKPLTSFPLVRYLHQRRIPIAIANEYLKEVHYELKGKKYYAIGFKNDKGGYELRNQYIKAASMPKAPTWIKNDADKLKVFEGFFDFLSYLTMHKNQPVPATDFLILNSTSFFETSMSKMQGYKRTSLFLDNDKTGQKFTEMALNIDKEKFKDERSLYQKYDDLNHWLTNFGLHQKQQARPKM
jgi:DNA primase